MTLLFVYGSLLPGEREAALLKDCRHLGPATTLPRHRLVDLGPYPALIDTGNLGIAGELFEVDRESLMKLDRAKELGRLFQRAVIELDDGRVAHAYVMEEHQVRGRRRLPGNDWRTRFAPAKRPPRGAG